MEKKKLLYIMSVDWNWIFQRPHIVALHLQEEYDVTVLLARDIRKLFTKTPKNAPKHKITWLVPFQERNPVMAFISKILNHHLTRWMKQFDLIWVGYPLHYRYVPKDFKGKLIYDCMDNHEAMLKYEKMRDRVTKLEKQLVKDCDRLLVSGSKLLEKMACGQEEIVNKTTILRNGTKMGVLREPRAPKIKDEYKLGYFGTIAEWFDFDLLANSLQSFPKVAYHLIGPVDRVTVPNNDRIIAEGIVPHDKLLAATENYDCLLMPFKLNDIVLYVDPVKLYEYISMGKCIIAVRYPEIERFEPFVYMYESREEYEALLSGLMAEGFPPKYNAAMQESFLQENTWEHRFETVDKVLQELANEA